MYTLQTVIRTTAGCRVAAIVLRGDKKAYSNEPKEFFLSKISEYEVLSLSGANYDSPNKLVETLYLEFPISLTRVLYERFQHYGGPEEGGWYYHTLHSTNRTGDIPKPLELDGYGEGLVEKYELVTNEFEKLNREIYM